MLKIKSMRKIFFIISLVFSILIISNSELTAQNSAPTYQSLITMGDKEFNNAEYIKAKSYYQEALRIRKDDPTAKSKLNKTLQKIREQSEKEEIFFQHIDEADNHYDNGDYDKALASYNKAAKLFPKDEYTLEQIKIVTQKITDEKENIAAFNEFINNGDRFMRENKYTEATLQYKAALNLYPNNNTAKDKYNNAKSLKENYDKLSADFEQLKREANDFVLRKKYAEAIEKYQQALSIFPNDSDLKTLITSLATQKDISDRYNSRINEADSLYLEKSYEKAKTAYREALVIIPEDSYSSDMIARIDETLNSDEYKSLKNFLNLLEEAKELETNNKYDESLAKYKLALKQNPSDEFTSQKIDYLTNLINNKNKEIELNAQYTALISKGDSCTSGEDFYTALDYYTQAYNLIPNRNEAKDKKESTQKRINEIEAQLALEKQKWDEYYKEAMNTAQTFMNESNYPEAIKEYNKALRFKENDPTATQALKNATQLNDARLASLMKEYEQYIYNADNQYNTNNLDKAIEFYSKALALNTGNSYPAEMIDKISIMLQENKLAVLVDENTTINSNETKKFNFEPVDVTTRKGNYILIKAKNLSDRSYTMFISYGSPKGNSGSLIVRIPNNQDTNSFIIKIGAQYKWFSEDNTWIELTPEGGNIEIELMEITKGK
jgi:tetratricopeptide (TPR) repeat protein